jgi:hypothetical protein
MSNIIANPHKNMISGKTRVSTTSSIHHHGSNMEISKCPEIQIKHTNSISILQASQIWCSFPLKQPKQTKSKENNICS